MDRIEQLTSFLAKTPNDSFLQHALALEYIKKGDDGAAKKLFEEVLERDPFYIGSYFQLAKLLERIGERDRALACYERGMNVAETAENGRTYNELQAAYEELKYE